VIALPPSPPAPKLSTPQGETLAPRGTLGRHNRLQNKPDFDTAFQRGRRAQGRHLNLIACLNRGPRAIPRLGLAVAKGVGHSPARARLRRLAREAFRALRPSLQRPFDLVVTARQPWPNAQLLDVVEELLFLSQKLRLLG